MTVTSELPYTPCTSPRLVELNQEFGPAAFSFVILTENLISRRFLCKVDQAFSPKLRGQVNPALLRSAFGSDWKFCLVFWLDMWLVMVTIFLFP